MRLLLTPCGVMVLPSTRPEARPSCSLLNPCRLRRPACAWVHMDVDLLRHGHWQQVPMSFARFNPRPSVHKKAYLVPHCINAGCSRCQPASGSLIVARPTSFAADALAMRRPAARSSALLCQAPQPPDTYFSRSTGDSGAICTLLGPASFLRIRAFGGAGCLRIKDAAG